MRKRGKAKISDALPQPRPETGKPVSAHEATAEQTREAEESKQARSAEASIRDRMVDIGRGNQQAGRQGS
jgi:hypothetical protein